MLEEYDIDQLNPRPNPYAKDVKKQRTIKITPSINGNESIVTEYTVILTWDDEAKVWVATSPDVTGLVLESESLDTLVNRVKEAVPELLELNSQKSTSSLGQVENPDLPMIKLLTEIDKGVQSGEEKGWFSDKDLDEHFVEKRKQKEKMLMEQQTEG